MFLATKGIARWRQAGRFPNQEKGPAMSSEIDVVKRFYDAIGRGDAAGVLATLDDKVEWTEAERFPYYTGTWHGPDAVFNNLLVRIAADWDNFGAAPHDFIAQGDRVVSLGTYTGTFKKTGRKVAAPYAHVWTVKGGKIAKFVMYTDTALILEAVKD